MFKVYFLVVGRVLLGLPVTNVTYIRFKEGIHSKRFDIVYYAEKIKDCQQTGHQLPSVAETY